MAGTFRVSRRDDGRYEITAGAGVRGGRVPVRAGSGMSQAAVDHTQRTLNRLDQATLDREGMAEIEAVIDRCIKDA